MIPGVPRRTPALAVVGLLVVLGAWLWPIGFGGRMPIGGDVTQFFIGLMAVLKEAVGQGRLPLWNDLWGFGFPGLAESQMGAYYVPQTLLYALLAVEGAYTANLVLHTLIGGLGASWAARRFGAGWGGGFLAGVAWAASGWFLIHLAHPWGSMVGSGMPWAWGLAWSLVRGTASRRAWLILAALLAIQTLPGHFQLAFHTQVGVLGIGMYGVFDRSNGPGRFRWRTLFAVVAACLAVLPLAAMQLWPTWRLAAVAGPQGTEGAYDYLSAFPATPLHLVSYVAPGLFHRSPLWRPVAWDPFHAMPEEHLTYIGLLPLFLALGTIRRGWKSDPAVRILTLLALGSLLLSLGPFVPGFSLLIRLPGFSFFRAPARWGLSTELALAILAGKGLTEFATWSSPRRSLVRFVLIATVLPLLVVIAFEAALASSEARPTAWSPLARAYDGLLRQLPWDGTPSFASVMAEARRPPSNPLVQQALLRQGVDPRRVRLDRERGSIYVRELGETSGLLVALLILAALPRRRLSLETGLIVLTLADLLLLGRHRDVSDAPIRPLTEQSVVLGRLKAQGRGTRSIDPLRNLPMVAGAAPVAAYRTLDRPVVTGLTELALSIPRSEQGEAIVEKALRATGTSVRVFAPGEITREPDWDGTFTACDDPELASWSYGRHWIERVGSRASTYTLFRFNRQPTRTWLVPLTSERLSERDFPAPKGRQFIAWGLNPRSLSSGTQGGEIARGLGGTPGIQGLTPLAMDLRPFGALRTASETRIDAILQADDAPATILGTLDRAIPLTWRSPWPERLEVDLPESHSKGLVVIAQLHDPEWRATWIAPDGRETEAEIETVFASAQGAGWQAVRTAGTGRGTLRLDYRGLAAHQGLAVSGVAWLAWVVAYWRFGRSKRGKENGS